MSGCSKNAHLRSQTPAGAPSATQVCLRLGNKGSGSLGFPLHSVPVSAPMPPETPAGEPQIGTQPGQLRGRPDQTQDLDFFLCRHLCTSHSRTSRGSLFRNFLHVYILFSKHPLL